MDVTHVPSFGKLSFVHVTIDTSSGYITTTVQSGETAGHACRHLLICFSVMGLPKAIKTDNGPAYTSNKFTKFCEQWNIHHTTGIPYNPKGQAIVERANCTLKKQLQKQKGGDKDPPQVQLAKAMFTLNFLNFSGSNNMEPHLGHTAAERHFNNLHSPKALEDVPIWWKDIQTNQWHLGTLLTWGRGYACISPGSKERPLWVPSRCIKPYHGVRSLAEHGNQHAGPNLGCCSSAECDHHSPDGISNDDPGVRDLPIRGTERPLPVDESLHGPPSSGSDLPSSSGPCGGSAAEMSIRPAVSAAGTSSQ